MIEKVAKQEIAYMLRDLKDKAWKESAGDTNSEVWEELYDKVFSKEISRQIFNDFPGFDYLDPDTTYQEDVCAFITAFCDYAGIEECNNNK